MLFRDASQLRKKKPVAPAAENRHIQKQTNSKEKIQTPEQTDQLQRTKEHSSVQIPICEEQTYPKQDTTQRYTTTEKNKPVTPAAKNMHIQKQNNLEQKDTILSMQTTRYKTKT